jgi:DNA end-binding protein Ku
MLVDELTAEWSPDKYTDDYRQNLVRIIAAKQKGQDAKLKAPEQEHTGNVVDLMERLRQSLEVAGGKSAGTGAARKSRPAGAAGKKSRRASRTAA